MKFELPERVEQLQQRFKRGGMSRRDFLRAIALLGVSLGANEFLAACSRKPYRVTLNPVDETRIAASNPMINDPTRVAAGVRMGVPHSEPG